LRAGRIDDTNELSVRLDDSLVILSRCRRETNCPAPYFDQSPREWLKAMDMDGESCVVRGRDALPITAESAISKRATPSLSPFLHRTSTLMGHAYPFLPQIVQLGQKSRTQQPPPQVSIRHCPASRRLSALRRDVRFRFYTLKVNSNFKWKVMPCR